MHKWLTGLLLIVVVALIGITNLERQQLRIEQEYQAVITENHELVRMNEMNLRLMAEGGWDGFDPISTTGTGD